MGQTERTLLAIIMAPLVLFNESIDRCFAQGPQVHQRLFYLFCRCLVSFLPLRGRRPSTIISLALMDFDCFGVGDISEHKLLLILAKAEYNPQIFLVHPIEQSDQGCGLTSSVSIACETITSIAEH